MFGKMLIKLSKKKREKSLHLHSLRWKRRRAVPGDRRDGAEPETQHATLLHVAQPKSSLWGAHKRTKFLSCSTITWKYNYRENHILFMFCTIANVLPLYSKSSLYFSRKNSAQWQMVKVRLILSFFYGNYFVQSWVDNDKFKKKSCPFPLWYLAQGLWPS